jgi:hypothetical protein
VEILQYTYYKSSRRGGGTEGAALKWAPLRVAKGRRHPGAGAVAGGVRCGLLRAAVALQDDEAKGRARLGLMGRMARWAE